MLREEDRRGKTGRTMLGGAEENGRAEKGEGRRGSDRGKKGRGRIGGGGEGASGILSKKSPLNSKFYPESMDDEGRLRTMESNYSDLTSSAMKKLSRKTQKKDCKSWVAGHNAYGVVMNLFLGLNAPVTLYGLKKAVDKLLHVLFTLKSALQILASVSTEAQSSVGRQSQIEIHLVFGPSQQKYCELVAFDLPYVTLHYNQKIILYPSPTPGFCSLVESLKKSLSEALVYFYPLAGRLCLEDGILRVDCNDAGVDFIEASAHHVSVADLAGPDASPLMQELVPFNDILNMDGFFLPMVAVQVTEVRDGVALGCAFNHSILDGYSTWHFMNSWAELCRGAKTISLPPLHDRTLARNTKVKLNITPPTNNTANAKIEVKPPLRGKIFHFSKDMMNKIKQKANKNREGKPFSSFQSLGAHVWQAVTRARNLAPQEITVFTLFIDCRTRLVPPLPKNYFGNVIQGIYGATAVGLLVSNDLAFAANMLQQVIDSHGAEAIVGQSEEWEKNPELYGFSDAGTNCVTVGSSPRFQVYDNDFGWGKPVRARNGCNNKFDGMVYLYPGLEGGGSVDLEISLLPQTMEMLITDAHFLLAD
eukprot:Gb_21448 [translate_table: standard]